MFKIPPPPPPKIGNQLLHQLADYYRQLINYHQQSAQLAAQQLAHVEALLNSNLLPDYSIIEAQFNSEEQTSLLKLPYPTSSTPEYIAQFQPQEESENIIQQKGTTITDELKSLLENNQGKILHLNWIVRKLYGLVPPENIQELTEATKKLLEEGVKQKKWYAMPDSPECWTIDLKEFPDLTISDAEPTPLQPQQYTHLPYNSRLPYSEKLLKYKTTTEAISTCLQEYSPQSITTTQVLDWLYPEGIAKNLKKKAGEAINNTLSKGVGLKGWQRVGPGLYKWTG